jgi:hypothetical protein
MPGTSVITMVIQATAMIAMNTPLMMRLSFCRKRIIFRWTFSFNESCNRAMDRRKVGLQRFDEKQLRKV